MQIQLKVWRQENQGKKGQLVDYSLPSVSPDMSFLEMLDMLNLKDLVLIPHMLTPAPRPEQFDALRFLASREIPIGGIYGGDVLENIGSVAQVPPLRC